MAKSGLIKGAVCLVAGCIVASPSFAGGLERGGYNIDLLFDPSDYAIEGATTYVIPQRKVKDVKDNPTKSGAFQLPASYSSTADDSENYWVKRIGVKASIGDSADCMFDYSEPWGARLEPGARWQGASYNIDTKVWSRNYAATCRYKFELGKGDFSIIGGGFFQEIGGYKFRQVVDPTTLTFFGSPSGVGKLDMEGNGWGWRAGVAYEIPEIAFRASLVYNSAVDHDLSGTVDLTNVPIIGSNPILARYGRQIVPVYGSVSVPDSVELKVQSGIAPDWLAFGSVKWTDWSQLQYIAFCPVGVSPCVPSSAGDGAINTLDLFYRDGWTVSGGVGHKINDQWSVGASLTWDRGTSTVIGTQTDTWSLGTAVTYSPTKNVEWRLAGVLGLLTSGESGNGAPCGTTRCGDDATYRFGNDLVAGVSTSVKIKF